ncbi:hypothetical protein SAY87_031197 [Trapa incisa]|uniref:C2 domain-containing protein n=1 Tax=Trapa incisa TaxID=236973 RepID=A0AAN7KVL1_9MYRT|nr:hypothetical protein SAY87_031197 [Trapa incisa]
MKPLDYLHQTPVFLIDDKPQPHTVELTVVSAEDLDASAAPISCSPFPRRRRLRPFASITMIQPQLWKPRHGAGGPPLVHEKATGVDTVGGENPTWGDELRVPVGPDFFANAYSCLYLSVYDFRSGTGGQKLLGWCQIPVGDFGAPSMGVLRRLSYRLKERHGTRGQGVVNVRVRVEGQQLVPAPNRCKSLLSTTCPPVIGIPVGPQKRPVAGL